MEKKYKLIKKYPGSPELGFEKETNSEGFFIVNSLDICPERWPEYWQEIKEPLFVTEDGVELFEYSDKVYSFDVVKNILSGVHYLRDCDLELITRTKNWKYFSNEMAIQKWIKENEPMFSKKQIMDAYERIPSRSMDDGIFYCRFDLFKKELGL